MPALRSIPRAGHSLRGLGFALVSVVVLAGTLPLRAAQPVAAPACRAIPGAAPVPFVPSPVPLRTSAVVLPTPAAVPVPAPALAAAAPAVDPALVSLPSSSTTLVSSPSASPSPSPIVSGMLESSLLESVGHLQELMSPWQRREIEVLTASLPRYEAGLNDGGFLHVGGVVVFPTPVEVRLGRTIASGGLITAIQRRNPFDLVNQLVFQLSW